MLNALPRAREAVSTAAHADAPPLPAAAAPAANAQLQVTTSVQMLVALAATELPREQRRRRAAEPVGRGLELLEQLHAATLLGTPDAGLLQELAAWTESFEVPEDEPELQALARDLDLRVRVELARHERIA
ncbi:MAG: flagellar assembly protein FliX [Sphingomonas sp.]